MNPFRARSDSRDQEALRNSEIDGAFLGTGLSLATIPTRPFANIPSSTGPLVPLSDRDFVEIQWDTRNVDAAGEPSRDRNRNGIPYHPPLRISANMLADDTGPLCWKSLQFFTRLEAGRKDLAVWEQDGWR